MAKKTEKRQKKPAIKQVKSDELDEKPKRKIQIRLVGTSHIAKQSVDEVKHNLETFKPDVVAIELDSRRLQAMLSKDVQQKVPFWLIFKIGVVGYIFAKLGSWGSKKLGKLVGVEPGEEMMTAVKLAKQNNLKLALIDQPIEITLARFSRKITFREKMRFIKDIFRSLLFRKTMEKELGIDLNQFDLTKVPSNELIKQLVKVMKNKYPNAYSVLVDERNHVMATNLMKIAKQHDKILAVVGAGHLEGMKEDLDRILKQR
ncbi:MAG: TraB/GumN family protein [Candidatus Woesearchaeota archaeon]